MAILKVTRMGHPVLRTPAQEVSKRELTLPQTQQLIDDMIQTMQDHDGIGLAAPQVHVGKQICIVEIPEDNSSGLQHVPLTVIVNPKVTNDAPSNHIKMWEGCLSIPGLRGQVVRTAKLTMSFWDRKGKERQLKATGYLAGVIQHEVDHLAGILFPDRMDSLATLSFSEEWSRYWQDVDGVDKGSVSFL